MVVSTRRPSRSMTPCVSCGIPSTNARTPSVSAGSMSKMASGLGTGSGSFPGPRSRRAARRSARTMRARHARGHRIVGQSVHIAQSLAAFPRAVWPPPDQLRRSRADVPDGRASRPHDRPLTARSQFEPKVVAEVDHAPEQTARSGARRARDARASAGPR